jgi:DNA-binding response OmpR family regulator
VAAATLGQIDVMMVDPDRNSQSVVKTILSSHGFQNLHFGRSLDDARQHMTDGVPDLLICESDLPDGDFCDFVYSVRHHEVGTNPFVAIIALTQTPSPDTVRRVSECGVDHLVVKPFSTGQMIDRIRLLIDSRKLYIVTSDYIGPDRRSRHERGNSATPMAVPNTLKAKAMGQTDSDAIQRAIDMTVAEINIQKLERYDDEIGFLVGRVLPHLKSGDIDETASQHLDRLLYVAGDTARRLVGTKYAHVSELCEALLTVTNAVSTNRGNMDNRDIQLLEPLSKAIQVGFGTGEATIAAAKEISAKALAHFRDIQAKMGRPAEPAQLVPRPPEKRQPTAPIEPAKKAPETAAAPAGPVTPAKEPDVTAVPADRPVATPRSIPAREEPASTVPAAELGLGFNELFIECLCKFIRRKLTPWHIEPISRDPLPFILSPAFSDRFVEVLRKYVANAIPLNRRLVVLSQSVNKGEISEAYFAKMLENPNRNENVGRYLWMNWWDDIQKALAPDAPAGSVNKQITTDAPRLWKALEDGAGKGNYDPPRVGDIVLLKALFDFDQESIRAVTTGVQQVLHHEATGEAGDGASRNYLLNQIESQVIHLGEVAAIWAYFTNAQFTPEIQKSFVASTGRTARERRQELPFYLRWAPDLTRRQLENGNGQPTG